MRLKPFMHRVFVGILGAPLVSCSGGITSSAGSADTSTGDVAGIYTGQEHLTLVRSEDNVTLDTATNRITITVNGDGTVLLSSNSGTRGEAQLTGNQSFEMRANARVHFSGRCSGGFVVLAGHVDDNDGITGSYRSRALVCNGIPHELTGSLAAGLE